ncbi:MAG: FAD:protein FMN transferase [Pirellula sp.]|jgi:thiamine biosynthesis lipoprotein
MVCFTSSILKGAINCLALTVLGVLFLLIQTNAHAQDESQQLLRFEYNRPIMGTELKVTLYAQNEFQATLAINAILEELEQRAKPINNYTPNSEVSRLANSEPSKSRILSVELGEVLSESKRWHELSDGAFDVTAGATIELWNKARKQKLLPSNDEISNAQKNSGWDHLKLASKSDSQTTLTIDTKELRINVSGIATGYLIDHAMTVLKQQGIESALIDIGGDIIVSNPPPSSEGWKVDIAGLNLSDPIQSKIMIRDQAVTTSGDLNQFTEIDGVRYSHIIDPATGSPIPRRVSATVVAKRAIDADAAATAIAVLGIQRAKTLLIKMPIDSVIILEQDVIETEESISPIRRLDWTRTLR